MDNLIRLKSMDNTLILDLIGDEINQIEFDFTIRSIKKLKNFSKLYINIANLSEINNEMINKFRKMHAFLKDKNICFINVNAINNSILNIFGIDKLFQIYLSKNDAIEAKKPVVNRKFRVV